MKKYIIECQLYWNITGIHVGKNNIHCTELRQKQYSSVLFWTWWCFCHVICLALSDWSGGRSCAFIPVSSIPQPNRVKLSEFCSCSVRTCVLMYIYITHLLKVSASELIFSLCVSVSGGHRPVVSVGLSEQTLRSSRCRSEGSAGGLLPAHTGELYIHSHQNKNPY